MKLYNLIPVILIIITLLGCDNNETKTLSASATAYKNAKGEVVVKEATQKEIDSLDDGLKMMKSINSKYPAPPTPLNKKTFAVKSITDNGIFILENNAHVSLSGIKCGPAGVHFIRKFFEEDTEKFAYQTENETSDGILESYAWQVDLSFMEDPDAKKYGFGPSFSSVNDMVILNNWCDIDSKSSSQYLSRYDALKKMSKENNR
jgi:uncharacterized lipoprotein NlpE involved in copper resistance